ncbi:hypothetical protein [Microbacterium sp. EST19A]|uniref:hypothetical protein n=1 Tax=Microbacterium sp. EST19A TaxID=2862681 RepID=UPI001CBACB44|nr:hypothetical protein [Microbacterium sp. EST19A]
MTGPASIDRIAPRVPRRPRMHVLSVIAITVVVTVIVAAALVVPVLIGGLTSTVDTEERTVHLTDGTAEVQLVLPPDWSWRGHFGDESRGVAGSPDRRMTIELELAAEAEPLAVIEGIAPGPLGPASEEPLVDGPADLATVVYARVLDQDVVVGAIADGPVVVTFIASPSPAYDAELADLLATLEVVR